MEKYNLFFGQYLLKHFARLLFVLVISLEPIDGIDPLAEHGMILVVGRLLRLPFLIV
jgi:hypothetical protein